MRAQPIWLAVVLAAGASCQRQDDGRVTAEAYREYLQVVADWAPEEAEIGRAVRRILSTEFVDDGEVRRQLAESLPRIASQLERMHRYQPPPGPLRDLHVAYVRAWEELQGACEDIRAGLDQSSQARLAQGHQGLRNWQRALPRIASDLRNLAGP